MPAYRFPLICAAVLIFKVSAASTPSEPLAQTNIPPEARQFDFWIGEWNVTSPDGVLEGTNRIEPVSNGHGLLEHWNGDPARGNGVGKSLNAWNAERKQWQQFWIGSGGGVLELAGGLDAQGRMVLSGEHAVNGRRALERITWTSNKDGSVRQHWERSTDNGQTWRTIFDGHYTKKIEQAASGVSPRRAMLYMFL